MLTDSPITTPPLFEIFWEQHRQKITLTIALLLAAVLLLSGIFLLRRSQRIASNALFAKATDVTGWQKVIARYPSSGAALNASLLLAAAARDDHHYDQSNTIYSHLLEKFPHLPLTISALLGRAMNDEESNPQMAIDEFEQAASAFPKSYGAPFALWNEARIFTRLGKKEEAKRVLTLISSQYPDSLVTTVMMRRR
ncbi:MAG: tol-pal system YbgF family protein [Chthoniobacterales bacterium]